MARPIGFRLATLIAITFAAMVLVACGGGEDSAPPPPTQTPSAQDTGVSSPDAFPEVVPLTEPLKAPSEVPEEFKAVWEAWALLTREHVDRSKLDPAEFAEAAIKGLLLPLNDPFTSYVGPDAFDIENQDLQGKFDGIGANVSMRADGKLIIVAPLEGSPAKAAGLRAGDVILAVNGETIAKLSLLEAVARIRGPRGSEVRLLVQHLGAIDPVEIAVIRAEIPLVSVLLRSKPGDRIAHIRITSFYADTADKLSEMIDEVVASGAEALVLDVRDNPGGLLTSVVDVASQFLEPTASAGEPSEGLVLYEVDGAGRRTNWRVRGGGVVSHIPMVVLANEFSASASEILVGAVQDHDRATVIGAKTFGKGSVNILRRLSNGGGLFITFARWFTPKGNLIQGKGLKPDIEVTSRDRQRAEAMQLERAIEFLEGKLGASSQVGDSGA